MNLIEFLSQKNQNLRFLEINVQNFVPPNYDDDLDERCHKQLEVIEKEDFDFLLLPVSVTQNFTEFSGLILAHHIRLSSSEKLRNVPILFYGYIDQIKLLKLTPFARILLTENVVYVDLTKYDYNKIADAIKRFKIRAFDINKFIETIELHPPANYDTHHSIDNEYALIRWSKHIGCYDKLPEQFRKEFDSRLYFKYLNVKNNVEEINDKKQFSLSPQSKTTILLIDDEELKGWGVFYKSYFQFSPNLKLVCSEIDFKNIQEKSILIEQIKEKINVIKPDVVLLDLRLIDTDFEETIEPEQLTGIRVIETIKEVNRGIQVIVTTASNKAWNFNLAKQKGAYDFIIKDGFDDPAKGIKRLKEAIEVCAKRAKFLKEVYSKIYDIKNLITNNPYAHSNDDTFRKVLNNNLDLAFELLDLSIGIEGKERLTSFAYLQFFLLIEEYVSTKSDIKTNPILREENMQLLLNYEHNRDICIAEIDNENKWISKLQFQIQYGKYSILNTPSKIKTDTNFFVSSILVYFFGNENSSVNKWTELYKLRNNIAHNISTTKVSLDEINLLLDFIQYFFDLNQKNDTNVSKGLQKKTLEESLEQLKKKYSMD